MLQRTSYPAPRSLSLALLALLPLAAPASANRSAGSEDALYRAYYLEHEEKDLEGALAAYRAVAADGSVDRALRDKARAFAAAVAEDLAASDLARLMPADTIFYAELSQPGERLAALLGRLGLLAEDGAPAERFGIHPALLSGALGLRGAALAITAIDPQGGPPEGVLVLHPGDLELARGLVQTALPAAGRAVDPIAGFPAWSVEGGGLVATSSRMIVAGNDRGELEGVLRRLNGEARGSLAENEGLSGPLAGRGRDLLFFCVNPEPVMPMVQAMLEHQAASDPQAAMALSLLDPQSLVGIAGSLALDGEGLALDLSLHLEEGHRNVVFDLLRMPAVRHRTLELVPEGAAFFFASALNEPAPRAARPAGERDRPGVSLMDVGRELFGNLVDLAVFALPPTEGARASGVPDVAAILRVNDPQRSHALWKLALGLGSQAAAGGGLEPEEVQIEGARVEVYAMGHVPVFLAELESELVLSPSRAAMQRTLSSLRSGRSVADDPAYRRSIERIDEASTFAALVHPGRCAQIAKGFMPPREVAAVEPYFSLFGDLVLSVGLEHSDTHMAVRARLENLPDVGGFVSALIERRKSGAGGYPADTVVSSESAAAPPPRPAASPTALRARFDEACGKDDRAAAAHAGELLVLAIGEDARALNNFAWELLTEERYAKGYDELARRASDLSNRLTDFEDWYCLDTLALACFRTGELERAVELQEKAVRLAAGSSGAREAAAALERYRAALRGSAKADG